MQDKRLSSSMCQLSSGDDATPKKLERKGSFQRLRRSFSGGASKLLGKVSGKDPDKPDYVGGGGERGSKAPPSPRLSRATPPGTSSADAYYGDYSPLQNKIQNRGGNRTGNTGGVSGTGPVKVTYKPESKT
eukprot:sb/3475119/